MEIKAQITKKLQKYKADEIKTLYQLMLRVYPAMMISHGTKCRYR